MIGKLRGIVDTVDSESVILDVNGVGYKVSCSAKTLDFLAHNDSQTTLYIETIVREDAFNLFGFTTQSEQRTFKQLIKIGGVGTKVALAILGSLTIEQMIHAVTMQDKAPFQQVNGVGPKMATRLLHELKDRLTGDVLVLETASMHSLSHATPAIETPSSHTTTHVIDAISALTNLGYQRDHATKLVTQINHDSDTSLDTGELIRIALKECASV